ncbi:MAG: hypothetical protein HYU56_00425, partial [Candidatus Aenigmarchaeota archaeon]|nr:hypothetical protein [Candidatus Aenigmarchaeota archaeon]
AASGANRAWGNATIATGSFLTISQSAGLINPTITIAGVSNLVLANQSNTFTASQSVAVNDNVNETVTNMLFLNHTTSAVSNGTAASNGTGIGSGIIFAAEDAAGQSEVAAQIIGMLTTVTNTTEAGALTFRTRTQGGALTERMRITGTGNVGIGDATPDALLDIDFSSTDINVGTEYGAFFTVTDTGQTQAGTDTTYGTRISTTRTGAMAGTLNTYGLYSDVTGDATGTSTAVAIYGTAAGADNNYAAILNGSVGINTTSPQETLAVGGGVQATGPIMSASGTTGVSVGYGNTADTGIIASATWGSTYRDLQVSALAIRLQPGGIERMTLDSAGLVGINTTAPQALLHINTSVNVNPFRITSASSASTFIVDSSGNVGVGTASPAAALDVRGSVNATGFVNATGLQSVNGNITLDKGNLVLRNMGVPNTTQERWLDTNGRVVAIRYWNGTALVLNVTS